MNKFKSIYNNQFYFLKGSWYFISHGISYFNGSFSICFINLNINANLNLWYIFLIVHLMGFKVHFVNYKNVYPYRLQLLFYSFILLAMMVIWKGKYACMLTYQRKGKFYHIFLCLPIGNSILLIKDKCI